MVQMIEWRSGNHTAPASDLQLELSAPVCVLQGHDAGNVADASSVRFLERVICPVLEPLEEGGRGMGRAEVLQGVRQMRFEGLLERHERGELSQGEAAEMLGVSERTFRRWRDRLRDEGPQGLCDRRIGKPSSRRAAAAEILRMLGLYEERYSGFTVKHFTSSCRSGTTTSWATR